MKKLIFILIFIPTIGISQNGPFYFTHNNIQREYYLHIPNNLPANSPIVYVLHGWGGNGYSIMSTSAFNILADQNNFAVCYPTALNGSSGLTEWDVYGLSDLNFLKELNDSLSLTHQLDINKVFATGFSWGGEMCYHIATCQQSNIFAAIAPLGGAMWDFMTINCITTTNIPVFILNGTNDNEFNYNGGYYPGVGYYLPVDSTVSYWKNHNSCSFETTYTLPDINNDNNLTEVRKYKNAITGNQVWLYKVNNGLHEWFDIAPWGSDDFWASEEIWNFFNQINNNTTSISEELNPQKKKLIKITDLLGRETSSKPNTPLIYIYDNNTIERKIIINK
ncbi:MAG: hypothetical protein CL844_05315 [Crocinitomicaceae bacterium]|nr:hypothetical protein [Crocinitomicaceae bacterium]|tara:strand:- start:20593 stop:21597 length:1005 start_codon:yes stop_codon:yes gene_type:complete